MNELVPSKAILGEQQGSFDLAAWLISAGRFNPLHIMGGPGSGKSRLVGRVTAWSDFVNGIPQVIIDPTGVTIANFIDKLNRLAPDFERRWWEQYRQPLPPEWIRALDALLDHLASRLIYVDMSENGAFPLYYPLFADESLFDRSQRFLEIVRRMDPELESASIEGWNALYRLGTFVGMILSALGLQITEAEDLIRNPEQWGGRFDQALSRYPEVRPAVSFFREFIQKKELRARRSDSFLTKILAFSADPSMAILFGTGTRAVNPEPLIENKQTALFNVSKIHNADRRRLLMLWATSEVITYAKFRGSAGRLHPFSLVIDEVSQILSYRGKGQSIMAADVEDLVSVVARNYGVFLTIMHQSLTQLDPSIQAALMQGHQIIGTIPNPDDAQLVACYFFRYNPYWVKKEIPVWMGLQSEPFYDPVEYKKVGKEHTTYQMDHVSTRTIPTIIDYTTEEFSIDEQIQLLTQEIQDLKRFQFLVKAADIEGQLAAPLRQLDIHSIDEGLYPDDACVAEACRRLITRSGFSKETVLAEIQERANKPVNKKQVKAPKEPARLNRNDVPADHLPVAPPSVPPAPAVRKEQAAPDEAAKERVFQ